MNKKWQIYDTNQEKIEEIEKLIDSIDEYNKKDYGINSIVSTIVLYDTLPCSCSMI